MWTPVTPCAGCPFAVDCKFDFVTRDNGRLSEVTISSSGNTAAMGSLRVLPQSLVVDCATQSLFPFNEGERSDQLSTQRSASSSVGNQIGVPCCRLASFAKRSFEIRRQKHSGLDFTDQVKILQ